MSNMCTFLEIISNNRTYFNMFVYIIWQFCGEQFLFMVKNLVHKCLPF